MLSDSPSSTARSLADCLAVVTLCNASNPVLARICKGLMQDQHQQFFILQCCWQQCNIIPLLLALSSNCSCSSLCAQGDLEFNVEVSIMAGLQHPNLVPLLGSCCETDQRVAVFHYMPHGNLRDLLDGKTSAARHFNWPARLNVLLGVAKGLAYLHHVCYHLPALTLPGYRSLHSYVAQANSCPGLAC